MTLGIPSRGMGRTVSSRFGSLAFCLGCVSCPLLDGLLVTSSSDRGRISEDGGATRCLLLSSLPMLIAMIIQSSNKGQKSFSSVKYLLVKERLSHPIIGRSGFLSGYKPISKHFQTCNRTTIPSLTAVFRFRFLSLLTVCQKRTIMSIFLTFCKP